MDIKYKQLRNLTYSMRINKDEKSMLDYIAESKVDLPVMLRKYIRGIYEELKGNEDMLG